MLNDEQLDRLQTIEVELLHLHRAQVSQAAATFELHEQVCNMIHKELARPLSA